MEVKTFTTDIDDFIEELDVVTHGKVSKMLDMLEEFENELEMPYSRSLSDGLFELRIKGKIPVRIFYCFYKNRAILLHIFIKKQAKIPMKEFDLARKRKNILA